MTYRRLLLVIAVVGLLGLITAWQQIQTTRWGYRISAAVEMKKQLLEEEKNLMMELTSLTSPQQLVTLARQYGITVDYRSGQSVIPTQKYRDYRTAQVSR